MIARLKMRIRLSKRGVNLLTPHAKKVLFFAQVQNVFTYGIGTWGNMLNQTQKNKLQKMQNQGVRLLEKGLDIKDLQNKHKILSINQLITLENYKIWYKEQHSNLPQNLLKQMREDHLQKSINKTHNYST